MKHTWLIVQLALALSCAVTAAPARTSCVACHGNADLVGEEGREIVRKFENDVHAQLGLSCHDCHGGNPALEVQEDVAAAMDERFLSNPYKGRPERGDIPRFCGKCHSDPEYMKRFNPDARVDIEEEYWTSQHGIQLRKGDTEVATCIDCHSVHGILPVNEVVSPVYSTNVAGTCAVCHSDAAKMRGRTTADGRPIPVNQFALWKLSVHAGALLERNDLSAPTCNDCHGNHGATPPGMTSINFVCGKCHGREAELFRNSGKKAGFETHNELIDGMGPGVCQNCHDVQEASESVLKVHTFSECATCHGNHAVLRPTIAMLSPLPETPCAFCHEGPEPDEAALDSGRTNDNYLEMKALLLGEAKEQGREGMELFDWLVERAQELPVHVMPGPDSKTKALRPEFAKLFEKFRIGSTTFSYTDPGTGEVVRRDIIRCNHCHQSSGDETDGGGSGPGDYLKQMWQLTSKIAKGERLLLRARRGGVDTRGALAQLEQAVDSQIELQVLLHGFSTERSEDFREKHSAGTEHAKLALESAEGALDELQFRRKGLAVSLVFILLLLIGLWLKIRELP